MKRWIIAVLFCFGALTVVAATRATNVRDNVWNSGLTFWGPRTNPPAANSQNGLSVFCQGSATHDFGALVPGSCTSITADAGAATVTLSNCAASTARSKCIVSASYAFDGGVQLSNGELVPRCAITSRSGVNAIATVQVCASSTDGGTYNPGPGALYVAVFE